MCTIINYNSYLEIKPDQSLLGLLYSFFLKLLGWFNLSNC